MVSAFGMRLRLLPIKLLRIIHQHPPYLSGNNKIKNVRYNAAKHEMCSTFSKNAQGACHHALTFTFAQQHPVIFAKPAFPDDPAIYPKDRRETNAEFGPFRKTDCDLPGDNSRGSSG